MEIKVGCDPELFVKLNGVFVSAYSLVPGTKEHPFVVPDGAVQVDGMALEFNINPALSANDFYINISSVMDTLRKMVPEYEMVACPVAVFSEETLKQQPAEALALGCTPDYNGWTMNENTKPDSNVNFRTASGHVHVGWTSGESEHSIFEKAAAVARQLDFYLGLPSLIFDSDVRRRDMYGKAGCFRPKPYGMEYRVLSNKWLESKKLIEWVYHNTVAGVKSLLVDDNPLFYKYDVQEIINTSDVQSALKIIKEENIMIPSGV